MRNSNARIHIASLLISMSSADKNHCFMHDQCLSFLVFFSLFLWASYQNWAKEGEKETESELQTRKYNVCPNRLWNSIRRKMRQCKQLMYSQNHDNSVWSISRQHSHEPAIFLFTLFIPFCLFFLEHSMLILSFSYSRNQFNCVTFHAHRGVKAS